MVRDSEKGETEKKGQGQGRGKLKLNPEWTSIKVRQGEEERRLWGEYMREEDKVVGWEGVSRGWRRESKLNKNTDGSWADIQSRCCTFIKNHMCASPPKWWMIQFDWLEMYCRVFQQNSGRVWIFDFVNKVQSGEIRWFSDSTFSSTFSLLCTLYSRYISSFTFWSKGLLFPVQQKWDGNCLDELLGQKVWLWRFVFCRFKSF